MKFLCFFACWLLSFSRMWADDPVRPTVAQIQEQVLLLGADAYPVREKAQTQLSKWGETFPRYVLTRLASAYQVSDDVEVEVRLRELLKPLAMKYLFANPDGYLGIILGTRIISKEIIAVEVNQVLSQSAAEHAGLKKGDLILLVNGVSIKELGGQQGFSQHISDTPPGSVMDLAVKREDREFLVRVILGMRANSERQHVQAIEKGEEKFSRWLGELKPSRFLNGMPVGHYPLTDPPATDPNP